MNNRNGSASLVSDGDRILVTGASGFIGARLVATLVNRGFRNVACLVRPSSDVRGLDKIAAASSHALEIVKGNLLSRDDCAAAMHRLYYHESSSSTRNDRARTGRKNTNADRHRSPRHGSNLLDRWCRPQAAHG